MKSEDVRRPAKVEVLLFHSGADTIPTLTFSSPAHPPVACGVEILPLWTSILRLFFTSKLVSRITRRKLTGSTS